MNNFWQDLMGGGTAMLGYGHMMDRIGDQRDSMNDQLSGLQQGIQDAGQFNPFTISSGFGNANSTPNGMNLTLSDKMQEVRNKTQGWGMEALEGSMQDQSGRETDIYNRIREMQAPEEARQYDQMNSNLFGSGRGGMGSAAYGGSPEQHAFGMAQAEARNQASLSAMGQAQKEQLQQFNMGTGMMGQSYIPTDKLMNQAKVGFDQQQLMQNQQMQNQNLMAEMGLGGMNMNMNYDNIMSNMYGNAINAGVGMMGGLGGAVDQDGWLGTLKNIFGMG